MFTLNLDHAPISSHQCKFGIHYKITISSFRRRGVIPKFTSTGKVPVTRSRNMNVLGAGILLVYFYIYPIVPYPPAF